MLLHLGYITLKMKPRGQEVRAKRQEQEQDSKENSCAVNQQQAEGTIDTLEASRVSSLLN